MRTKALLVLLLAASIPAAAEAQTPPAPASSDAAVDARAMNALERMRAYLRTLRSFEVRAETTIQEVLSDDAKLDLLNRVRYEYRAPDRLFIDWRSDRRDRRLYFDGDTVTLYAPRVGYYAQADASGTVAEMLTRAAEERGIVFPLPDLFYWATHDSPAYDIQRASYVGPAKIAGVDLDHYFFQQPDVDWQLWIERGERPFPRKIVITDRADPARPSLTALLSWNPDVKLGDDRFVFKPPAGVHKIDVAALPQEAGQ